MGPMSKPYIPKPYIPPFEGTLIDTCKGCLGGL